MSLFKDDPVRRIRDYFVQQPNAAGDRFVKGNVPTQTTFQRLFNSAAFILERADRAKEYTNKTDAQTEDGIQGLVVLARPIDAKNRLSPTDLDSSKQPYSYCITPEQLPELEGAVVDAIPTFDFSIVPDPEDCIKVIENKANNPNHSVWKLGLSNTFLNWLWAYIVSISNSLTGQQTQITANNTNLQNQINKKVDKSDWNIAGASLNFLRIYDFGGTQVKQFDANFDNTGSFQGYCRLKYKVLDDVLFIYFDILITPIDMGATNVECYRFDINLPSFGSVNTTVATPTIKSIGKLIGAQYALPTTELQSDNCDIKLNQNGTGCILSIFALKPRGFQAFDIIARPQNINSVSATQNIEISGQIFANVI